MDQSTGQQRPFSPAEAEVETGDAAGGDGWQSGLGTATTLRVIFSDSGRFQGQAFGPRAIIAGAALAGLTAAAGLHRAGWRVQIHDCVNQATDDDAMMGVALSASAVLALRTIGADAAVLAAGEPIRKRRVMLASGKIIRETNSARDETAIGVPGVMLTRADLLGALRSLTEEVPTRHDSAIESIEPCAQDVGVTVMNGAGDRSSVRAEALIGADGVASTVRAKAMGTSPVMPTRWQVVYGIADAPISAYPAGMMTRVWGQGVRMGVLRVPPRRREIASPHRVAWWLAREVWSDEAGVPSSQELRALALAWTQGWATPTRELIMRTGDEALRGTRAKSDAHAAEHSVCRGRVVLLGDAAHPLWPLVDDGAAMAVRDGMLLTTALASCNPGDVPDALRRFEARRDVDVRRAIRRARLLAPIRNGLLSSLRDGLVRVMPRRVIAESMEG